MSLQYQIQSHNKVISGRFIAPHAEAVFEAKLGNGSVCLRLSPFDGELALSDFQEIRQLVSPHFRGAPAWVIFYESLRIIVPANRQIGDRLTVCGLGIGGFTLSEALDASRQIGYFYMSPT